MFNHIQVQQQNNWWLHPPFLHYYYHHQMIVFINRKELQHHHHHHQHQHQQLQRYQRWTRRKWLKFLLQFQLQPVQYRILKRIQILKVRLLLLFFVNYLFIIINYDEFSLQNFLYIFFK